jgi:plastocyanin
MNKENVVKKVWNKNVVLLSLIPVMVLFLAGCASKPKTKTLTIVAEDILWNPSQFEAEVGQEVQITLRNDGALDHNFVSEEMEINILLSPGEVQIVSFVVSEAGTLSYICNIPGHEEAGMVGEIVVGD